MNSPINKNPSSGEALDGLTMQVDIGPIVRACTHIVAYDLLLRNNISPSVSADTLQEVHRYESLLLDVPVGPSYARFALNNLINIGIVDIEVADELMLSGEALAMMHKLPLNVDSLLYIARHIAAYAIAEEKRSGVPGLWAALIAGAEALPTHVRDTGENGRG